MLDLMAAPYKHLSQTQTRAFIGSEGKLWSRKGRRCGAFDGRTVEVPVTDTNTGIYWVRGQIVESEGEKMRCF